MNEQELGPEWTRVQSRLPEFGKAVLVLTDYGKMDVCHCGMSDSDRILWYNHVRPQHTNGGVIAWAELPEVNPRPEQIHVSDISDQGGRYRIFVIPKPGTYNSDRVANIIGDQPEDGFDTEADAIAHLDKLIQARRGMWFERDWYLFFIMRTFSSLSR